MLRELHFDEGMGSEPKERRVMWTHSRSWPIVWPLDLSLLVQHLFNPRSRLNPSYIPFGYEFERTVLKRCFGWVKCKYELYVVPMCSIVADQLLKYWASLRPPPPSRRRRRCLSRCQVGGWSPMDWRDFVAKETGLAARDARSFRLTNRITQLAKVTYMTNELREKFCCVSGVLPYLNFMRKCESGQKLMVHISPYSTVLNFEK